MADTPSVAQAQDQVNSAQDALTKANQDVSYRTTVFNSLDSDLHIAADKAAGKTADSPEAKYYNGLQAQWQTASNNLSAAQANAITASNNLTAAQQNLTTAQQTASAASSQTAGDAATTNTDPATQNTGTDSGDRNDPVTGDEEANQTDNNDDSTSPVPAVGTNLFAQYVPSSSDVSNVPTPLVLGAPAPTVPGQRVGGPTDPNENILDSYASYTYGLTLHVLTKDDYNTLVQTPTDFTPTKTLISSASRYQNSRDPEFNVDFYFDDFKLETVIGQNATNRGTNAITMSFTIIEPYGMTLLDRIINVNNTGLNGKNYLDMPYLLELNFFGADDSGQLSEISAHTKWFPIKFISFKIKASTKGSEYAIEAIPFNHVANLDSIQSLKTRMEITAKTVAEYFAYELDADSAASVKDADNDDTKRQEKIKAAAEDTKARQEAANKAAADYNRQQEEQPFDPEGTGSQNYGDQAVRKPEKVKPTDPGVSDKPISIKTKSFAAAYNAWNQVEVKRGTFEVADEINFVFVDHDIENSSIVDPKKNSSRKVGETDAATNAKSTGDNKDAAPAATADFQTTVRSLDAGTSINDIVNLALTNSKWWQDQTVDSATQNASSNNSSSNQPSSSSDNTPLRMWKIVPSVILKDFDHKRNEWGKIITFYVNSYDVHQQDDDRMKKAAPPNPVKIYNYTYTGHNKSILSFELDFNTLYYNQINADRGNGSAATGPSQDSDEKNNNDKTSYDNDKGRIDQTIKKGNSGTAQTTAGGSINSSKAQNAASAAESRYTSAGGDMITLDLTILGDPEFIKQDDLFLTPANAGDDPKYAGNSGSLKMDESEIFCYVTFRTPTDFNQSTGLYDLDSSNKYAVSEFSGYYQVNTVSSEFKSGKFIQILHMYRVKKQEVVNKSNTQDPAPADNQRNQDTTNMPADNPAVSAGDVAAPVDTPPPQEQTPPAAEAETPAPEAQPPAGELVASDENPFADQEDQNLAKVADTAPTVSVDEATSSDGNTVPVQSIDVKAATDATNAQDATTQITALSNANLDLQVQNAMLTQQNSILQQQGNLEQVFANKDIIAKNQATEKANADKAFELARKYKLDIATGTTVTGDSYIKLG